MERGIDSKAIQDLLGHKSLMTTERYLRRKKSVKDQAGVKIEKSDFLSTVNR
jgi:integrase/recombinase XerD